MAQYEKVIRDGKPSDALVIHCSDPDFQKAFRNFIASIGIGKYDPIVEPGPSKFIVDHPDVAERMAGLQKLHHFERAVILDHIDCGGFGISEPELEIQAHFHQAKLAKEVILRALPDLAVEFHLLGWDSEITEPNGIAIAHLNLAHAPTVS